MYKLYKAFNGCWTLRLLWPHRVHSTTGGRLYPDVSMGPYMVPLPPGSNTLDPPLGRLLMARETLTWAPVFGAPYLHYKSLYSSRSIRPCTCPIVTTRDPLRWRPSSPLVNVGGFLGEQPSLPFPHADLLYHCCLCHCLIIVIFNFRLF